MSGIILYIWLIAAAVAGYGAAFFFAFFALDDPKISGVMTYVVYFIAWFILGTIFSMIALLALPVMAIFSLVMFIFEQFRKRR